ncbi:hypothetical protein V5G65_12640 [Mammaliicoccus sciuri]|uniref:hypothetical protein n=1 Tax=Mammaliicoccus sciuri TaxID=1296 RepID=UPI0037B70D35
MLYKLIQESLSEENIESLTLNLVNNQAVNVSEYNESKSDKFNLFVIEPLMNIVVLKYVVSIEINYKNDLDVSKIKF